MTVSIPGNGGGRRPVYRRPDFLARLFAAVFVVVFFAVFLAAFRVLLPADFFAAFFGAFFGTDFLPAFFAVRFSAARFFLRAPAAATGGTISGSEAMPSPASGM